MELERSAQHELHLPRSAGSDGRGVDGRLNHAELARHRHITRGLAILGAIEDVEHFPTELERGAFADRVLLRQSHV
jgi:hypothetical protein